MSYLSYRKIGLWMDDRMNGPVKEKGTWKDYIFVGE